MNKRVLITAMMVMVLSFAVVSQHAHAQSYHFNLDLNDLVKKAFGEKTGNEATARKPEEEKKIPQSRAVQHVRQKQKTSNTKRHTPPPASAQTLSFWEGTMTCGRRQRAMRLTVSGEGSAFEGVLETTVVNMDYASLKMQGSLDSITGQFQLKPTKWVQAPRNIKPMGLKGIFVEDNKTMSGQVMGGKCSTFTARHFDISIPPVNPNGLLFKVKKNPKSLSENDCLTFTKWVNSGKRLSLPDGGMIMTQILDDKRMREVLGKSLFQWVGENFEDYKFYRSIESQCSKMAEGTFNMELAEEVSKVRSWYVASIAHKTELFNTQHKYLSVYAAFLLKQEQQARVKALPLDAKSLITINDLLTESHQRNNRIAWLPKDELMAYQTFLEQQKAAITQSLADESSQTRQNDGGGQVQITPPEEDTASYSPLTTTRYLNEMPRPDQIMVDIQGSSQLDTAARQYAAFSILIDMVVSLSPRKPNQGTNIWLSPEEKQRNRQYSQARSAISRTAISTVNPSGTAMQTQYQWFGLGKQYAWQGRDHFMQRLLKRYFSEDLQEIYLKVLDAR